MHDAHPTPVARIQPTLRTSQRSIRILLRPQRSPLPPFSISARTASHRPQNVNPSFLLHHLFQLVSRRIREPLERPLIQLRLEPYVRWPLLAELRFALLQALDERDAFGVVSKRRCDSTAVFQRCGELRAWYYAD